MRLAFDPAGRLNVASALDSILIFNTVTGALIGSAPISSRNSAVRSDTIFDSLGRLYLSMDGNQVWVALQGEPVTRTDANGAYSFNGLVPGTYTVAELVPANSTQTFDLGSNPAVIRDLNPGATNSNATGFIRFNGALYFQADGGDGRGAELWRDDGRTVTRVTDINPGAGSSSPANFTLFNNALYFSAGDATFGTELWRYDGIDLTRITDISPNAGSAFPANLTVYNNLLLFTAADTGALSPTGGELYSYNGFSVQRLTDINVGGGSSNISSLTPYGGVIYFSAFDGGAVGSFGTELYRYNGSTVVRAVDINPGTPSSSPANLLVHNGLLYMTATDAAGGRELWWFNGSTVSRAIDIIVGAGSSNPANSISFNGSLYFTANDGTNGVELWRYTNSISFGRVTDINPVAGSSSPGNLIVFNNALYFSATDAATAGTFGRELWRWDGTTLARITDISPGPGSSSPASAVIFDNALYFTASDTGAAVPVGNELWKYDGSTLTFAADINPGSGSSNAAEMTPFNGALYMRGTGATQGAEFAIYNIRKSVGSQTVALLPGAVAIDRDFGNFKVVDIGADRSTGEGTVVNFTSTVLDPNPATPSTFSYLWQIVSDNGQVVPNSTAQTLGFTPVDNGTYTVTLSVTDSADGKIYRDTAVVFVRNVTPFIITSPSGSAVEGTAFTRSVPFTDPGADVWTVTIDYGDGSGATSFTGPTPAAPVALNHIYLDEGQYTLSLTIDDGDGGINTRLITVTVTNAAPTVSAGLDQVVGEGTPVTLFAVTSDPGANDVIALQWSVVASNGQVIPQGSGNTFAFTPLDNGIYTVTVTASDGDSGTATDQVVITVSNVIPTAALAGPSTINEGGAYTLMLGTAIDPGADVVTQYRIDWGDGLIGVFNTPGLITHLYANEGIRIIDVSLVDEDGTHVSVANHVVTVENVAAVLTGIAASATELLENQVLTLTGTFTDPGIQDSHSVQILWGDGTAEQVINLAVGVFDFSVTHRYLDDNPSGTGSDFNSISVRINDGSSDSTLLTKTISVSNIAPTFATITSSAPAIIEGGSLSINGTLADGGTTDSHTVTVDWGDGSAVQSLIVNPAKTFSGNHAYNVPGTYQVIVIGVDDDGGFINSARSVVVMDLAPIIASTNFGTVAEGALFDRAGSFADATGPEDSWTGTVRFDNGPMLPLAINPDKTFQLQHIFQQVATHNVTVTIVDRFGLTDTRSFAVAVQVGPQLPTVLASTINGESLQRSRLSGITVQFNKDVGSSLGTGDLTLRNLTTATDVASSNLVLSYDNATNKLTVTLASGLVLAAGNYRLTLRAIGITDQAGRALGANVVVPFHILPGDANGDRVVNDVDLFQVWRNSVKPVVQQDLSADLTGDGRVTIADVNLIKSNYRLVLDPEPGSSSQSQSGSGSQTEGNSNALPSSPAQEIAPAPVETVPSSSSEGAAVSTGPIEDIRIDTPAIAEVSAESPSPGATSSLREINIAPAGNAEVDQRLTVATGWHRVLGSDPLLTVARVDFRTPPSFTISERKPTSLIIDEESLLTTIGPRSLSASCKVTTLGKGRR